MLKTDAYFAICSCSCSDRSTSRVEFETSEVEEPRWRKHSGSFAGSFDFAQDDFAASSTARLIAAIMLSGRAMPLPAISNAVPWSGLVRGNGSPSVTFTPLWNACSFNGINP